MRGIRVYKRSSTTGRRVADNEPGTWTIAVSWNGKRKRKACSVDSRRQAEAIGRAMLYDMQTGVADRQEAQQKIQEEQQKTQREIQKLTGVIATLTAELEAQKSNKGEKPAIEFEQFTKGVYLPHKKIENKDTYYIFENMSRIYIARFKDWMLHTITKGDVLEWWQSRAEGKTNRGSLRSLASLNRELNILGGLFAAAVERGYIKTNPCDGIKRHKVDDKGRIVVLEEDAEKKLFAALTGAKEKFKPVVILALNTGLRLKEVTGLRWDQVTLSDNEDEREITVLGKGDKWRTIPLNDVAYGVLKELRSKSNGKGPVFSERGLTKTNVGHQIANICDEIGLPNITMHVMRHTFASVLVRRGDVNPEQLRKLMGHSNLRITQRYFHLNKKSLRETVKKLEKSAPESAPSGLGALHLAKEE